MYLIAKLDLNFYEAIISVCPLNVTIYVSGYKSIGMFDDKTTAWNNSIAQNSTRGITE